MSEQEKRLLVALAWMCVQWLGDPAYPDDLDHECMSAGEGAVKLLVEYGLVDPHGRGGTWNEAGKALLNSW